MIAINPYSELNLSAFIILFFQRLFSGALWQSMESDELQILTLTCIALSCATLGTFLIFRKMAMLANALSHTILLGIVLAYLLERMFIGDTVHHHNFPSDIWFIVGALVSAVLTTLLTDWGAKIFNLHPTVSTGIVFTVLFALGIVLVTAMTRNSHIGTELLIGNADAIGQDDLPILFICCITTFCIIATFYRGLVITSFDPIFAEVAGFSYSRYTYVLMSFVAILSIFAFRAVGVFLVLAFFVIPPLTAHVYSHSLKKVLVISNCVGVIAAFCGVALSRHILSVWGLALSTGGIVVMILTLFWIIAVLSAQLKKIVICHLK